MKDEIVAVMKEYEILRAQSRSINLELFEVEEEGNQYQRALSDSKTALRQLQQQLIDIDVKFSPNTRL